ncbi:hypothetical protein Ddye_030293 [Dipteronia dyeriana]|uniref:Reverse transcriptase zinc-binding domain-containing protein n=1 Tax=Dipteronia dyeriana TaxID=168575 RepID=A0AAD9TGF9_9ROSI|nr:hypothetical protein Ddye_030293 [Dipteronia dyeriana]
MATTVKEWDREDGGSSSVEESEESKFVSHNLETQLQALSSAKVVPSVEKVKERKRSSSKRSSKTCGPTKNHGMTTRKDTNQDVQYVEVIGRGEVAKEVAKEVALGVFNRLGTEKGNTSEIYGKGMLSKSKKYVVFCNVYAANVENDRIELWKFILNAQVSLPGSWMIRGDFNIVLFPSEMRGGIGNMRFMMNFQMFSDLVKVVDIPLQGLVFTWSNNMEVESGPDWTVSLLVNGSPTKQFPLEKGLRQGNPLSPFLFNLVVEVLNTMLFRAKDLGLIKGVGFGNEVTHITYLDPNLEYLLDAKRILRCFELASGLPLCGNPTREAFWRPVIAKVEHRLAHWKRGFLSKGGKLILIKAVLSSLPTYCMLVFRIPIGVAKKIEKAQRNFFWNDGLAKKKMHVMDRVSLCKNKKNGGLEIGRMRDKGLNLMAKWLWWFGREENSLWKVVCGNGERIKLWKDIVWDSIPLKYVFSRIFALSSNKGGAMKELSNWGLCPLKVEVFSWQLLKGRILLREVLRKMGGVQMANLGCPLCGVGNEYVDHLFLLCSWFWELWSICMGWCVDSVHAKATSRVLGLLTLKMTSFLTWTAQPEATQERQALEAP